MEDLGTEVGITSTGNKQPEISSNAEAKSPKIKRKISEGVLGWVAQNWPHILGLVSLPLSIALVIIQILSDGKRSDAEKLQLFGIVTATCLLFMSIYIFVQFVMVIIYSGKNSDLRKRLRALEVGERNSIDSSTVTSRTFSALEESRAKMDSEIATVADRAVQRRGKPADDNEVAETIYKILDAYLREVCNAGPKIISARKGLKEEDFSSNIKFVYDEAGSQLYRIFVRSNFVDAHRIKLDNEAEAQDGYTNVGKNYFHYKITEGKASSRPHYVVKDIKDTLHDIRAENEKGIVQAFNEPSHFSIELYTSCVVVPIKGPKPSNPKYSPKDGKRGVLSLNNEKVIGFLCIDSKVKSAFDDQYDLSVMKQLACAAYNAVYFVDALTKYSHSARGVQANALPSS